LEVVDEFLCYHCGLEFLASECGETFEVSPLIQPPMLARGASHPERDDVASNLVQAEKKHHIDGCHKGSMFGHLILLPLSHLRWRVRGPRDPFIQVTFAAYRAGWIMAVANATGRL
jgi:hypothetical protein